MAVIRTFDELLMDALHDGLKDVMGESAARATAFYVDPHIAVKNIRDYESTLRKIFGQGAALLERKIVEKLYVALHLQPPNENDLTLAKNVLDAKSKLTQR